jgi:uncharacterized protein YdcH (DUF465 family)
VRPTLTARHGPNINTAVNLQSGAIRRISLMSMSPVNRADAARAVQAGDRRVLVGILDTGVDGSHPDIAPNLVALYASRAQGAHFAEKPERLYHRIKEIEEGRYRSEWDRILKMNDQELADHCATVK